MPVNPYTNAVPANADWAVLAASIRPPSSLAQSSPPTNRDLLLPAGQSVHNPSAHRPLQNNRAPAVFLAAPLALRVATKWQRDRQALSYLQPAPSQNVRSPLRTRKNDNCHYIRSWP